MMQAPSSRIPPVRAAAVASDLYKPCACLHAQCALGTSICQFSFTGPVGSATDESRQTCEDIDRLLLDTLPEVLSEEQKLNRIKSLLSQLVYVGLIRNDGSRRYSRWVLESSND